MSPRHVFNKSAGRRQAGSSPRGRITIAWEFDTRAKDLQTFGQCPDPCESGNF
jgi:hypothetical protein